MEKQALSKLFDEVLRILRYGGLFIFDTVTNYFCKKNFNNIFEHEMWKKNGYQRHSYYDKKRRIQITTFKILIGTRSYEEKHQQRIYTLEELSQLVSRNDLHTVGIFQNFSLEAANKNAERIHFVCKKT